MWTMQGWDLICHKPSKIHVLLVAFQHHKEVAAVEKTIIVTPSSKAAVLEVFYKAPDAKQKKKLEDGQELSCTAGQTLSGLSM